MHKTLLTLLLKSLRIFSVKIGVGTPVWTRQRKFMSTFWALRHAALNERRASGTREGSAVGYVKGEAASGAVDYSLSLRHDRSLQVLIPRKTVCRVLKSFLERLLKTGSEEERNQMNRQIISFKGYEVIKYFVHLKTNDKRGLMYRTVGGSACRKL